VAGLSLQLGDGGLVSAFPHKAGRAFCVFQGFANKLSIASALVMIGSGYFVHRLSPVGWVFAASLGKEYYANATVSTPFAIIFEIIFSLKKLTN
jgi:hypothetical protein